MNTCHHSNQTSEHYPVSFTCPVNKKNYASVKRKTILHHLSSPWNNTLIEQGYYFCTDPDCDVVYFGQNNMTIHTDDLRTSVWQKSHDENAIICYCFGVTKKLAVADERIKNFVLEQTKDTLCSCETRNPSGRCCLKNFSTIIKRDES